MGEHHEEIEFKAGVDTSTLARLRRHPALRPATVGRAATRKLVSLYYDAGDLRLMQAGLFLRLRRQGGRWEQTVKAARRATPGLQRVIEVTDPADGPAPDLARISVPALREELEGALAGAALSVACRSDIYRTVRILDAGEGRVELAFDRGEVSAGEAVDAFCEVEIECIDGSADPAWDWAQRLLGNETARLVQPSKAARGFTLAAGGELPPCAPLRSNPADLGPQETTDAACAAVFDLLARAIAENLYCVLTAEDVEGPHQLRVSLRRLRTFLRAGKPFLRRRARDLARDAQRLGRIVGRLRDADVLAAALRDSAAGDDAAAWALDRWHAEVRAAVRADLRAAGATRFAIELLRLGDSGDWRPRGRRRKRLAAPVAEALAPALDAWWMRARKRGDRLGELDAAARHRLRKDLKTLRYLREFAGLDARDPAWQTPGTAPALKALGRLQDSLGDLNDEDNFAAAARTLPDRKLRDALERRHAATPGAGKAGRRRGVKRAERAWQQLRRHWRP